MNYQNKLLILVIILVIAYVGEIFPQQELYIKPGKEDYSLSRYVAIMEDKGNTLSINEAASDSMNNKYVYYNKESLNFGFSQSAFWLRLIIVDTLKNPVPGILSFQDNSNWIIIKHGQILEDVRVYYKNLSKEGNKYSEILAGSKVPVNEKFIKSDSFIANILIKKNVPDTVYLRVQTKSPAILSLGMLTTGAYVIQNSIRNLFHGILFGIFFLLIVYNTLLYLSIKDNVYIFYVLYIFSFTIFIFVFQGYYLEIIGRLFYNDYFILPLATISVTGVLWLLLTREFLSTKYCLPWAYKLLTYITPLAPIICISTFAFTSPWLAKILSVCLLGYYIVGIVVAFITFKKGIYLSKFYLLSLSGITFSIFISVATRNNFLPLPYNIWTENALSLGILWEALILAATVGYRFNVLKIEKEKEKALMRNQIAADLHDEIGSNLSTISLQSRMMMKAPQLDDDSKKQLQEITNIAGITTDTIRDIVWFINPFHDKSEDLLIRMKELASKMLINLNYNFSSSGNNELIFDLLPDLNKRRHIYLIFKEILNNVIKHSDANEVSILLSTVDKKFIMIIADNGKGFNEDEIIRGEGLRNLRNRAVQAGAQILIESNTGRGTKITLDVPL